MKVVTVQNNQSVIDIAVRYCGTAEAAFDVAEANDMDVTDRLYPGQEILIPEINYGRYAKDVVGYFDRKGHQPATEIPLLEIPEDDFGMLPGMFPMILS